MLSWAPFLGPFLCYLGVGCPGPQEADEAREGAGAEGQMWWGPHSLASCLGLVSGLEKGHQCSLQSQPSQT